MPDRLVETLVREEPLAGVEPEPRVAQSGVVEQPVDRLVTLPADVLGQVLVGPNVDANRIAGAVCVYILLGYVWSVLYLLVALAASDAFAGVDAGNIPDLSSQLTYFSFVTLTTLGYGDISPLTPIAQSLTYLEAIIGQLYVAILIAGLVGAHLSNIRK